jgi:fluoroacetyl-CoA thioesterase
MSPSLAVGLKTSARYTIDESRITGYMGPGLGVYATPAMLWDIERTCRAFAKAHLADEEDTVGAHVTLDHLGSSLLGSTVEVTAEIVAVEGRRITFEAEVRDGIDLVGRARHVRFVVDKARQRQRLEAKAAKLAALSPFGKS